MIIGDSYRKKYWPLVLWVLLLLPAMLVPALLAETRTDELTMTKLMLAIMILALDFLLFLIWKLEAVYWFSGGPDFEAAKAAGSEKRRLYAWRHLKRFLVFTVPLLAYLTCSTFLRWSIWPDIVLVCVGIMAAALSTIGIRFE